MQNKINIRVYKRNEVGTILIWNTDPLSADVRQQPNFEVQIEDGSWIVPKVQIPDVQRMGRVIDSKTDTTMIQHTAELNEKTKFVFRLSFGPRHEFSTLLEVQPRNEYQGHYKIVRVPKPNYRVVYAAPAFVVGLDDDTKQTIGEIVKDAVKEAMTKK